MAADTEETIARAGQALIEAAKAPAKVILFGSHARGEADEASAIELLVIEDVENAFDEMARLSEILGRMMIPADVIVVSLQEAESLGTVPGTVVHHAIHEGRLLARS